jgi:tungsten cofactor oxidoreducase radical SAM maturase
VHTFDLDTHQVTIKESVDIRKLYIELSAECNFECKMCFRHTFTEPLGDMSDPLIDRIKETIDTLPKLKTVVFGGIGEALLHPRLKELLSFARQKDLFTVVSTNGYLLHDYIDFFIEHDVNKIVVSFESGDIGHPNEGQLWDTIKTLVTKREDAGLVRPVVTLELVLSQVNVKDLGGLIPRIREAGIDQVVMSNLMPIDESLADMTLYPGEEPPEVTEFRTKLLPFAIPHAPNFEIKTERYCQFMGDNAVVIRWDGEIAPCYRFLHSGGEVVAGKPKDISAVSFGNLLNEELLDIWNSRAYAWFRYYLSNKLYPSCIDCTLRDGCQYTEDTESDCWGNENTCGDCLWERKIIICP